MFSLLLWIKEILTADFWINISNTAWFQAVLTVSAAIIVSRLTYIYTLRASKQGEINEALAKIFSFSRAYRLAYLKFIEYDLDFQNQQQSLKQALSRGDKDEIEIQKTAAFLSQEKAFKYNEILGATEKDLMKAGFTLYGYINERLSGTKLDQCINELIDFHPDGKSQNFDAIKKQVDEYMKPRLTEISSISNKILWEQNKHKVI